MIVGRGALAIGCAFAIAGCGADDETGVVAPPPRTAATATGSAVRGALLADGQRVFERSGCFACHQIGAKGAAGPGNSLTGIGARRSPAEIRRALLDPPSRMPSYGELGSERLDDLVAYLSALHGNGAGGEPCPADADCG